MNIQSADIILVHKKGFSWLRLLTGMQYNHVFIIDEPVGSDWQICESIDKGTAQTLLSGYAGSGLACYRYKGITPDQQQDVRLALASMGTFKYDYLVPFRAFKRAGLINGFKQLFKLWCKDYPLEIPHTSDKWVVCSEYAQEAYWSAGIPILDHKFLLLPDSPLYHPVNDVLELVWQTDCFTP